MSRCKLAAVLAIALASCGDPAVPAVEAISFPLADQVGAQLLETGVLIQNPGDEAIRYFAVERQFAARINWAPCTTRPTCPQAQARTAVLVDYTSVAGWTSASEEALVYWWRLVAGPTGELEADSIRFIVASGGPSQVGG